MEELFFSALTGSVQIDNIIPYILRMETAEYNLQMTGQTGAAAVSKMYGAVAVPALHDPSQAEQPASVPLVLESASSGGASTTGMSTSAAAATAVGAGTESAQSGPTVHVTIGQGPDAETITITTNRQDEENIAAGNDGSASSIGNSGLTNNGVANKVNPAAGATSSQTRQLVVTTNAAGIQRRDSGQVLTIYSEAQNPRTSAS